MMSLGSPTGTALQPDSKRTVVVILGCHRSGTSALAGTLGLLGGTLPAKLLKPNYSNEKGYFEPQEIASLHDEVLASAGSTWNDWSVFPSAWDGSAACEHYVAALADAFHANYGDASLAILKDPRMNRLMSVWRRVFARLGIHPVVVIINRNPLEVAESLHERDGSFLLEGLLIWLRNQLDAEASTRDLPRVLICYNDLLRDWRAMVARIETTLDIVFPDRAASAHNAVDAFLAGTLRHHRLDAPSGNGVDIIDWTANAFDLLSRLEPSALAAMADLDRLRGRLDACSHAFTPLVDLYARRLNQVVAERDRAGQDLAQLAEAQRQLSSRLGDAEGRIATVATQCQAAELAAAQAETKAAAEVARRSLAEAAAAAQEAHARELQHLNAAVLQSMSWRITGPLRGIRQCFRGIGTFSTHALHRLQAGKTG
jgi:hypothetical protein